MLQPLYAPSLISAVDITMIHWPFVGLTVVASLHGCIAGHSGSDLTCWLQFVHRSHNASAVGVLTAKQMRFVGAS